MHVNRNQWHSLFILCGTCWRITRKIPPCATLWTQQKCILSLALTQMVMFTTKQPTQTVEAIGARTGVTTTMGRMALTLTVITVTNGATTIWALRHILRAIPIVALGILRTRNKMIKEFCDNIKFTYALNNHSYGNYLIYPYGYGTKTYTPDSILYKQQANRLVQCNEFTKEPPFKQLATRQMAAPTIGCMANKPKSRKLLPTPQKRAQHTTASGPKE